MSKSAELKYKYNLPREVFDYLEKLENVEQQKAELINLLCERCDYIGACEIEEIPCAVKKHK